jgi:2-oxoglutarate ferredoxin oxidoreductase subunit alpha
MLDLSFSIAVTGSGGSGAITTGLILLESLAKSGLYGLMSRSVGPQIRGGESVAMLRLSNRPVDCLDDRFDLLVGLDWQNVERFMEELPLDAGSRILTDQAAEIPAAFSETRAQILPLPVQEISAGIEGGRNNMVVLGMIGQLCGLSEQSLIEATRTTLSTKGEQVVNAAVACIQAGYTVLNEQTLAFNAPSAEVRSPRWNISGNEAGGLGALRGGVRFAAAYPITPASEMLEWLAPRLESLGGALLQAEDELASINMVIGASFGGVPALTATSGPGLSLMVEGMGLAVASEIPLVVMNVTRGGPSTGIPTKSEQSDLDLALYGMHGDAPHLVLAPLSIGDCALTAEWAVGLAERLQSVAIVLLDQFLGQARSIIDPLDPLTTRLERKTVELPISEPYLRYGLTSDGISPMALPGMADCRHTAEGLEHNPRGNPSSTAKDHLEQLEKRQRKLLDHDYGDFWMHSEGEGELCLLTWGSSAAAVLEAGRRLRVQGRTVLVVALRLLAPLQRDGLLELLQPVRRVLVVEQNHQAQFFRYLHARQVLPQRAESYARAGPLLLRPGEIIVRLQEGEMI